MDISNLPLSKKKEILQQLIRDKKIKIGPLTSGQKRLWFVAELNQDSANYNLHRSFEINGELSLENFRSTIEIIVEYHESLRTNFKVFNSNPMQVIMPTNKSPLIEIDLSEKESKEKETELKEIIYYESNYKFNLSDDKLFRPVLVKLSENRFHFIITIHHIITDGISNSILYQDICNIYSEFVMGNSISKAKPKQNFIDFALNERNLNDYYFKQLDFWKDYLQGYPICHNLPLDYKRPTEQTFEAEIYKFKIDNNQKNAIDEFIKNNQVTYFVFFLTAYSILLSRYSGSKDQIIGYPQSGRNGSDLEKMIGFFVNTIVIRIDTSREITFLQLLSNVKSMVYDIQEKRNIPFDFLIEQIKPVRNLSYSPLVQLSFAFHHILKSDLKIGKYPFSPVKFRKQKVSLDIELHTISEDGDLHGYFLYNTSLFKKSTIENFAKSFDCLLGGIVNNPHKKILSYEVLDDINIQSKLRGWSNLDQSTTKKCLHELFEEQAEKTPSKVAIKYNGEVLSYKELNQRANQLARYIKEIASPRGQIGILLDSPVEQILAILAVWKAGKTYVPIDPNNPLKRTGRIIKTGNVNVIITTKNLIVGIDNISIITPFEQELKILDKTNLFLEIPVTNSAYILFTSGTTGNPKGVEISHQSLVNTIEARKEEFVEFCTKSCLQLTNYTFDQYLGSVFTPLICGGKLILTNTSNFDPEECVNLIQKNEITHIHCAPAKFYLLLKAGSTSKLSHLKCVSLGGEKINLSILNLRKELDLNFEIANEYGPTECTVTSTLKRQIDESNYKNAGKALKNFKLFIFNSNMKLQPLGVIGELYIGGIGLAKGYINNKELTDKRFIENPYECSEIIYKTGDYAKYLENGEIEILGRIDDQLKVNGYRIESQEIEANILKIEGVKQCVVDVEVTGYSTSLIAYLITDKTVPIDIYYIKSHLKKSLPEYMIPTRIILVENMPLTSRGKTDFRKLRKSNPLEIKEDIKDDLPINNTQTLLLNIWKSALNHQNIGIHDNFFDLGGHSMLIPELISQINSAFGKKLSYMDFFRYTSINTMASLLVDDKIAKCIEEKPINISNRKRRAFKSLKEQRRKIT